MLAVFSIGLGLLIAGTLLAAAGLSRIWAAGRPSTALASSVAGMAGSIALMLAGTYGTDLPVTCPHPDAQGSGSTNFHGVYSYTCHGGTLVFTTPAP